jgi:hypothetical protein
MNERAVREAFRTAVERYCNLANASGLTTRGLRVAVEVTTEEMLTANTVKWINQAANDHVFQMLPGAIVGSITFPVVPGLPDPGHHFVFRPRALPEQPVTKPIRQHVTPPPPPEPVAVLTIRDSPDFDWRCRIGSTPGWLAVGRWTEPRLNPSVIQLPTYATSLPRGGLLLVRNRSGRFTFGRSTQRPQYEIRVDGVSVHPGGSVEAHSEGLIEYVHDHSSTLLTYRVEWEGHHA